MRDVTGISLYVYKHGNNEAHLLTFHKADSNVVDIGRKAAHPKNKNNPPVPSALFRCPVISRRHAKITFTNHGSVQIVDLSSHHGTHILQDGDSVSTMLAPEMPKTLSDGDVITFGKSVGRDDTLVRPVTVRVNLLFGTTALQELSPSPPAMRSTSTYSGRFGVYPRSSSSSSSRSSSPSNAPDGDSDVEEIPRPAGVFPVRPFGCAPMSLPLSLPSGIGRYGLLRRILPQIDTLEEEGEGPSAEHDAANSAISVSSTSPSPDIVEVSPNREPSVVGAWVDSLRSSRQSSPEPLPATPPATDLPFPFFMEMDPHILFSRDSPVDGGQRELDVLDASDAEGDGTQDNTVNHAGNVAEGVIDASSINDVMAVEAFPPVTSPAYTFPPPPVLNPEVLEAQTHPAAHIQPAPSEANTRPPPPDLFDARMFILKSRLADLEKQLVDQKRDSQEAEDRTSETNEAAQAVLRMRDEAAAAVDTLKDMVKAMEDLRTKSETEIAQELDAVRAARAEAADAAAEAKAHALAVAEMRKRVRVRMEAQSSFLHKQQAHVATETTSQPAVEAEVQADGGSDMTCELLASAAETFPLKRKRSELDELDDDLRDRHSSSGEASMQVDASPAPVDGEHGNEALPILVTRPMKRRRVVRVLEGVAKTSAIAAVGAVAAWSALAFT